MCLGAINAEHVCAGRGGGVRLGAGAAGRQGCFGGASASAGVLRESWQTSGQEAYTRRPARTCTSWQTPLRASATSWPFCKRSWPALNDAKMASIFHADCSGSGCAKGTSLLRLPPATLPLLCVCVCGAGPSSFSCGPAPLEPPPSSTRRPPCE